MAGPDRSDGKALFSFLYLKKQNFKNIRRIGKFSKIGACCPLMGDRVPVAHPVGDMTAQGALNSELVKSI